MSKEKYFTGYNSSLKERARELRKAMTQQEKRLWYDFLRKYPVKFCRQRVIDGYIADFFSYSAKLVIEIDGNQHYTEQGKEYDSIRTEILQAYGLEVIRFKNEQIEKNFQGVCEEIDKKVTERI